MLVAIPCEDADGLRAVISEHFGRCSSFTLVEVDGNQVRLAGTLSNTAYHSRGCLELPLVLHSAGVEALLALRIGRRPLLGFLELGIQVWFGGDARSVGDALELLAQGRVQRFRHDQVCPGPSQRSGCRLP
jgi:predicted Fe-Mo cluster-binding NifX family protein